MKNCFRKTLSLLLALSLLCALTLPAAASEALGEDLTSKEIILNEETQLSTNVFWSTSYSDLRQENFITYTPNRDVTPIVTFGGVLTQRTTVTAAARENPLCAIKIHVTPSVSSSTAASGVIITFKTG